MIRAIDLPKNDELYLYSNPIKAQKRAFMYLGKIASTSSMPLIFSFNKLIFSKRSNSLLE